MEVMRLVIIVFVISWCGIITRIESADESKVGWCRDDIEIRFPFHLKASYNDELHENQHVFPPGFQLSGDYSDSHPMVEFKYEVNTSSPGVHLSFSVQAYVLSIDYSSQQLLFEVSDQKIKQQQRYNNYIYNLSSTSPFKSSTFTHHRKFIGNTCYAEYAGYNSNLNDYTFYNCSGLVTNRNYIDSLSGSRYQVCGHYSHSDTAEASLQFCKKMYSISDVPFAWGVLTWSQPNCGHCEAKGLYCKFKPNTTTFTQCYNPTVSWSDKLLLAGKIGGICFMVLTFVALCYALKSYKQLKRHRSKIEMFLEDYKALKPSRYSYADIKKITNQFKVKLGEGGFGSVFKGQLSNDILVAVKLLNDRVDAKGSGEDFVNEVSTIGLIYHVNVVRLVGYCAHGCNRALVYEFLPNNSLDKYAYSRDKQNKDFLGWEKMKDIAVGIAKGIEYLHQGCAHRILHLDIKPNNILLDQNFNPKIADFGLAKLCAKRESMVSMTMARGTIGYIAPEVFSKNFGKVSSKLDVYSFGMLLLEMVGAKDHTSAGTENMSEKYFPEWVFYQLERGGETRIEIEEGVVPTLIARKLTIIGLWCINWHPADRPSMKRVIQMLQEEECPAIPPNPFNSATSRDATAFGNNLEVISESD